MTKNDTPKIDMTTTNDRRAAYWAQVASTPTIMPDRPARRLPPKSRRNSVRHRSIR